MTPGRSVSTMNSETPRWRDPGSVWTAIVMKWARVPLVMNILRPLITQVSPSRTARVVMLATSDPVSGSVRAIAPIFSPEIAGRR